MKLSTKGRYGLKAMVDLATNYGCGLVSVNSMAASQGVSEAYLERIISTLKRAGLVRSIRGAGGGYELLVPPECINVGQILRALEGSTTVVDCVSVTKDAHCQNACQCSARPLWLKLQRRIDEVLDATTLKDLADDYTQQRKRLDELNMPSDGDNSAEERAD